MSLEFSEELSSPIISPTFAPQDAGEIGLRPKLLSDYTGQEKAKGNLSVYIDAARLRNEPLDHTLLYGPPGLGKTTLAGVIANEMGVNIRITSGPAIEKPGDLAALLTNLSPGDILFIDEIHRLNRVVEEILYPAMEDFAIDIIVGKGPSANSIRSDRRYHPCRTAFCPSERQVWRQSAAGAVHPGGAGKNRHPFRNHFGYADRAGGCYGDCLPQPWHAPNCQPLPAPCPGLCPDHG